MYLLMMNEKRGDKTRRVAANESHRSLNIRQYHGMTVLILVM